jgi:hypothetical protein
MPTMDDEPPLTTKDRIALELALKLTRAESEGRAAQLLRMQLEDGWFYAARFAAYNCQVNLLRLQPWEHPPVWCHDPDDYPESPEAAQLLRRMLKAGVSRYDPDPMSALEKAENQVAT